MDLTCPGCGEPSAPSEKDCRYCGRPIVITTFSSIREMSAAEVNKYASTYTEALVSEQNADVELALGICFLKLGLYEKASGQISNAISSNVDNAEAYLYAAVAALRGKRPFLVPMAEVRGALEHLDAARMLEDRGVFDYVSGLVRQDFFERKFLRITPSSQDEFSKAYANNVSQADIEFVHELMKFPRS